MPAYSRQRANIAVHSSRSWRVYVQSVRRPVVPEEAWMRTTSRSGAHVQPKG